MSESDMDSKLPDNVLQVILSSLSIASVLSASLVSKRWYEVVRRLVPTMPPQQPWYLMPCYGDHDEPVLTWVYDPILRRWRAFNFPFIEYRFLSASGGLVCFIESIEKRVLVGNPITQVWDSLPLYPRSDHIFSLCLSTDERDRSYTVALVLQSSWPALDEFSIHVYESRTRQWLTLLKDVFEDWVLPPAGRNNQCVICDGVLYFLVICDQKPYRLGMHGFGARPTLPSRLEMYDLGARPSSRLSMTRVALPTACTLTSTELLNLRGKVVIVGWILTQGWPRKIEGIGIWEFQQRREWRKVAQMPDNLFQKFEFNLTCMSFRPSGAVDLVYIEMSDSLDLIIFDLARKEWEVVKCPTIITGGSGFCFQPKLSFY